MKYDAREEEGIKAEAESPETGPQLSGELPISGRRTIYRLLLYFGTEWEGILYNLEKYKAVI